MIGERPPRRRLFVAVDVDESARAACAATAERLRDTGFDAKWIDPRNYHVTVAFLGAVDDERVAGIVTALRDVAPSIAGFSLPIDAVGAFPNARKARVAWAGPATPVPAFAALCGAVRAALHALGWSFEHDADPHVTLARAEGRKPLPAVAPPATSPVRVDALALYQSFTERAGARYVALERFTLSG